MNNNTEPIIRFTIPLAPVTKKNSQRIFLNKKTGKPFITPSEAFRTYETMAKVFIPKTKINGIELNLRAIFYMPTHRRCDLTNLLEAIDDILVNCGLIEDDNYTVIAGHDGSRVRYDKNHPRTEIEIYKMGETDNEKSI